MNLIEKVALSMAAAGFCQAWQGFAEKSDRVFVIACAMCRNAVCCPEYNIAPGRVIMLSWVVRAGLDCIEQGFGLRSCGATERIEILEG